MKKFLYVFLTLIFFMALSIWILNLNVTTRYGIGYEWHEKKIPLYLKALRFVSRDLEMRFLVHDIVRDKKSSKEKPKETIEALFQWVIQNIKLHPPNMPVIDDHPWSIIVRGYGDADQLDDVFSLMAMVAGFKACYKVLIHPIKKNRYPMAFVFYENHWVAFDLRQKISFIDLKDVFQEVVITPDCMQRNLSQFPLKRLWWELLTRLYFL